MEVSDKASCLNHFNLGKEYEAGWAQELVCTFWRRENLLLLPKSKWQFLHHLWPKVTSSS